MKHQINEIIQIQSGIYAKPAINGDVLYLLARHLREDGSVDPLVRPNLVLPDAGRKNLLQDGDVIFVAKGTNNRAVTYHSGFGPMVASSSLLVFRIKSEWTSSVLSDYLIWFFNHPDTQQKLKREAKGTALPSISIQTLHQLQIDIPSLDNQNQIITISRLRAKETQLILELDQLKEKSIQQRLLQATHK
jgi:restriction endonuclease S subunit